MTAVAPAEIVRLGTLQMWELVNAGGIGRGMMGMMGMTMAHPIHLHGEQFQVYERYSDPTTNDDWLSLKGGVIDAGWQDTVMLFPGQRVKILRRFDDFEGLFLYHCHNLEHEDMGMMRNVLVQS
jgi:FtsP/CotA-like multicopper oxidase with cupredoxin domain